jgi:hypothetical protein
MAFEENENMFRAVSSNGDIGNLRPMFSLSDYEWNHNGFRKTSDNKITVTLPSKSIVKLAKGSALEIPARPTVLFNS